jgi:hypothetical protein
VDITATFELLGTEYEWKWYATDVAPAMAIAGLTERVHGRTDPSADNDHDFTPLSAGGRWVAVNPLVKAEDLTNNEAVHMALALQTILQQVADGSWIVDDEDFPIDRWLLKTSCREQVDLLVAYVQQAQIACWSGTLEEAADKHNGLMGEDRFSGRFGINSYFFEVPAVADGSVEERVGSTVADGSVEERVGSPVAESSDDGSGDDTYSDAADDDSDAPPPEPTPPAACATCLSPLVLHADLRQYNGRVVCTRNAINNITIRRGSAKCKCGTFIGHYLPQHPTAGAAPVGLGGQVINLPLPNHLPRLRNPTLGGPRSSRGNHSRAAARRARSRTPVRRRQGAVAPVAPGLDIKSSYQVFV